MKYVWYKHSTCRNCSATLSNPMTPCDTCNCNCHRYCTIKCDTSSYCKRFANFSWSFLNSVSATLLCLLGIHFSTREPEFNYSCTINRLTFINIYISEMQSAAPISFMTTRIWGRGCGQLTSWPVVQSLSNAFAYANTFKRPYTVSPLPCPAPRAPSFDNRVPSRRTTMWSSWLWQ